MPNETALYDELCAELGDPFDQNTDISVTLWAANERMREALAEFREVVRPTEPMTQPMPIMNTGDIRRPTVAVDEWGQPMCPSCGQPRNAHGQPGDLCPRPSGKKL